MPVLGRAGRCSRGLARGVQARRAWGGGEANNRLDGPSFAGTRWRLLGPRLHGRWHELPLNVARIFQLLTQLLSIHAVGRIKLLVELVLIELAIIIALASCGLIGELSLLPAHVVACLFGHSLVLPSRLHRI